MWSLVTCFAQMPGCEGVSQVWTYSAAHRREWFASQIHWRGSQLCAQRRRRHTSHDRQRTVAQQRGRSDSRRCFGFRRSNGVGPRVDAFRHAQCAVGSTAQHGSIGRRDPLPLCRASAFFHAAPPVRPAPISLPSHQHRTCAPLWTISSPTPALNKRSGLLLI